MSSTFWSSYLSEVTSNLSNWYEDNYDYRRFGPQPKKQLQRYFKDSMIDTLRHRGYVSAGTRSNGTTAATKLVDTHLAGFAWLYDRLGDDESRDILVKVLAFRALGYRRVKLPLNTPAYWDELTRIEHLANPSDFILLRFLNWQLNYIDLNAIGLPIRLYDIPLGAHGQFVLEQYRCRRNHGTDISVDAGDYVIDTGACWGDTALYFAHRSRPEGKVICYEFMPDNLDVLRRNLALNADLSKRIQVIERAAWDESGVRLSIQGEGPASSVGYTGASDTGPLTLAIDDLVQHQNLPNVDFIKMDIEGSELSALRGAKQTIQRCRPKLAISVYHRLTDFYEVPQFLDSLGCGYRYFLRHYTIHAEETVLFAEADRQ